MSIQQAEEVKQPEAAVEQPPVVEQKPDISKTIETLVEKINSLESKLSAPKVDAGPVDSDVDKEIQLRTDQIAAIRRGEIDAQYEGEIMKRLTSAQIKKEADQILSRESQKAQVINQWNQFENEAKKEFPELEDKTSEHFKLAKELIEQDPSYQKYVKAVQSGKEKEFDFSSLDPRVNLRCAREAYAIIQRRENAKPKSAGLAKTVLEGRSTAAPQLDELAKVEQRAMESGDRHDWLQWIKQRDQSLRARKATL